MLRVRWALAGGNGGWERGRFAKSWEPGNDRDMLESYDMDHEHSVRPNSTVADWGLCVLAMAHGRRSKGYVEQGSLVSKA